MADVARHIRIFDTDPSDDLVTKRTATIIAMAAALLKLKGYHDYFRVADDVAHALQSEGFRIPDKRAIEIEEAIHAQSPAFSREGQDLQMLTCMMLAVLSAIEGAQPTMTVWSRPEILAVITWLSLGIEPPLKEPRLEALRVELVEASRSLIIRSAEHSRARIPVPDREVTIKELSAEQVAGSVNDGLLTSIDALRRNAALDREELDMLWWSLGDWSALQRQHFRDLSTQVAAVSAGIEGSHLLRRLPSEGHKHIVLRHIVDDSERSATELVTSLGTGAKAIRDAYSEQGSVGKFPRVFRLLAAISGASVVTQSLGNRTWGARAMLEAVALRFAENNDTVL